MKFKATVAVLVLAMTSVVVAGGVELDPNLVEYKPAGGVSAASRASVPTR